MWPHSLDFPSFSLRDILLLTVKSEQEERRKVLKVTKVATAYSLLMKRDSGIHIKSLFYL